MPKQRETPNMGVPILMHATAEANKLMHKAIAARHPAPEWSLFFEMRCGTGYHGTNEQRMDAFAINNWPSKGLDRHAYEMKASRNDFMRERRQPNKRQFAMSVSNYFWFILPIGIVREWEVPADCGFLEVDQYGSVRKARRAPRRESEPPTWNFIAAVLRRAGDES